MFKIDFAKLASRLVPVYDKLPILLGWVKALVHPLKYVNDAFLAYITATRKALHYNGQVILLEVALNDKFPGVVPPIYITDGDAGYPKGFDYFIAEAQPDPGGFDYYVSEAVDEPGYDYLSSEYDAQVNFVVNVPATLSFNTHEMTAFIKQYALIDKKFSIRTL
jgi:hypothetical protein